MQAPFQVFWGTNDRDVFCLTAPANTASWIWKGYVASGAATLLKARAVLADSWQLTPFHGREAGECVGERERFNSLWEKDIWISWHAWQHGIRWQGVCVTLATNKSVEGGAWRAEGGGWSAGYVDRFAR